MFRGEGKRERRLLRLRQEANRYAERARTLRHAGQAEQAAVSSQQAMDVIERLRVEEPDNDEHLAQLAAMLYNHAGMLAQAGRTTEALDAARQSLARYLELTDGGLPPEMILADRLESLSHTTRPVSRPADLARRAALTADAQCRLALLLAESHAPGAAAEAVELASKAAATYRYLVAIDNGYRDDLTRVTHGLITILGPSGPG